MRAAAYARRVRFGCVMCASVSICQCSVYISCREIDWTCESLLFFYGDARLEGWAPGPPRLCHLCRACEQQRSCSPGFRRKELHARCCRGSPSVAQVEGSRHGRARWSIHSGQRRGHSGQCGVCPRHSGEVRDRLWRGGSRPWSLNFSVNSPSTDHTLYQVVFSLK